MLDFVWVDRDIQRFISSLICHTVTLHSYHAAFSPPFHVIFRRKYSKQTANSELSPLVIRGNVSSSLLQRTKGFCTESTGISLNLCYHKLFPWVPSASSTTRVANMYDVYIVVNTWSDWIRVYSCGSSGPCLHLVWY